MIPMPTFRTTGFVLVLALASSCSLSGAPKQVTPTKPGSIAGDAAALKRKIERARQTMKVDRHALLEEVPAAKLDDTTWKPLEPNTLDYHAVKYRISLNFPADSLVAQAPLSNPSASTAKFSSR